SGSVSTTSEETTNTKDTTAQTTSEDTNLPAYARDLQPQIEEQMTNLRIPGALVYVDVPGEGTWIQAFGTGTLGASTPITPNDHVRIGSNTKTFTGTVILQLVDEGKLGLDDPVSKYQPEVPNGENITIRQLLNMTSGLFNYAEDGDFNQTLDTEPQKVWEPRELVEIGFKHQPYFSPGDGWHYSNTNFILLGMIIEQLTGQPLEKEFQERIFVPLGMSESLLPERSSAAIPNPHPRGYMYQTNVQSLTSSELEGKKAEQADEAAGEPKDVTDVNPSWGWAAGSTISTVNDLIIWAKADATGQLLSPQTQKERLSWVSPPPSPEAQYGLAIAELPGSFVGHDGQIPGFNSVAVYQAQKDATVVVVTNVYSAPDGSQPATDIFKVIIKELSSTGGAEETTGESTG
ncbi:MAG: beta-lactamase family protein, partial [Actinobacteria bacterium]|nr:beta-lactamase family protein [Actinomycetota bacterium]